MLLTELYQFMETTTMNYENLEFAREFSLDYPDSFTQNEKLEIQKLSQEFYIIMNAGATTHSIDKLQHFVESNQERILALFIKATDLEYSE